MHTKKNPGGRSLILFSSFHLSLHLLTLRNYQALKKPHKNSQIIKKNPIADSTTPYTTLAMSQMEDSIHHQQDQPDSSSEHPLFTLIPPDGQSTSSGLHKNDSNNNHNDRNNNTGKSKAEKMEDEANKKILHRYTLDNGTDSPHHTAVHHPHHLLLLQQQQQQMNHQMSHMDGKSNLISAPENSPSLIVLQPSAQSGGYSSFFNHYVPGK